MSNNTANTETPLWKQGKNPDLKFANLKLLERQEPSVYELIEWKASSHKILIIRTKWDASNGFCISPE